MPTTYADARFRYVRRQREIDRLRAQQDRIRERLATLYPRSSWFDMLVRSLAIELKRETGAQRYEIAGPFGLNSEWYVDLIFANGRRAVLSGIAGDLDRAELEYHTGEYVDRFAKGTLGEQNGLNRVTAPLPSAAAAIVPLLRWTSESAEVAGQDR